MKMKTENSDIRYYDVSSEDLARYLREAEVLRSQAVQDMFVGAARKVKLGVNALGRSVSRFFHDLRTHAPMSSGS
jgi:hypothetical protein